MTLTTSRYTRRRVRLPSPLHRPPHSEMPTVDTSEVDDFTIHVWTDDGSDSGGDAGSDSGESSGSEPSYGATKSRKSKKKASSKPKRKFVLLTSTLKDTTSVFTGRTPDAAAKKAATDPSQKVQRVILREHKGKKFKNGYRIYKYDVKYVKQKVRYLEEDDEYYLVEVDGSNGRTVPAFAIRESTRDSRGMYRLITKKAIAVKTGATHIDAIQRVPAKKPTKKPITKKKATAKKATAKKATAKKTAGKKKAGKK